MLFLLDSSALARWRNPHVAAVLDPLQHDGRLAVCGAVEVEVMRSARSSADAERIRSGLHAFTWLATTDEVWDRAVEVQQSCIGRGTWKALSLADLVIAAVAERHRATVLHYDSDFDLIAGVTGQPARWVAARGTTD